MAHPVRYIAAALVLLAVPTRPAAQSPEPTIPPVAAACAPLEGPEPLVVGLRHVAGAFPPESPESEFLADVIRDIEASHRERGELCLALDRQEVAIVGLRRDIALADKLAASHEESARGFEKAWREALAAPEVKRRWWACGVGAFAGIQLDAEGTAGIGGACIVSLVP